MNAIQRLEGNLNAIQRRKSTELLAALAAIILITLVYLFMRAALRETPRASSLAGHGMGIFGFILMLMTEVLYSVRKRARGARWGRMSTWLQFHIFTGIVGPYLVILHTGWLFNGLAGVLTLFTVVIVVSGFIGRYIYTAIPRAVSGAELSPEEARRLADVLDEQIGAIVPVGRAEAARLKQLGRERDQLRRQADTLARSRRWMALWHAVHVPIGLTLFVMALVHILAATYYAVLK